MTWSAMEHACQKVPILTRIFHLIWIKMPVSSRSRLIRQHCISTAPIIRLVNSDNQLLNISPVETGDIFFYTGVAARKFQYVSRKCCLDKPQFGSSVGAMELFKV